MNTDESVPLRRTRRNFLGHARSSGLTRTQVFTHDAAPRFANSSFFVASFLSLSAGSLRGFWPPSSWLHSLSVSLFFSLSVSVSLSSCWLVRGMPETLLATTRTRKAVHSPAPAAPFRFHALRSKSSFISEHVHHRDLLINLLRTNAVYMHSA